MKGHEKTLPFAGALLLALAAGCGGDQGSDAGSPAGGPGGDAGPGPDDEGTLSVVATGLQDPFEILWGPDARLWITERTGKRVTRISPNDGAKETALTLDEVMVTPGTQDGLLGMALDPDLLTGSGHDYVYLAYTYDADPTDGVDDRRVKLVRYTFDGSTGALGDPLELLAGLPGSGDHNGGRLVFGPDRKLYYSIGDQGANQLTYACVRNRAQDLPSEADLAAHDYSAYQGKVLRLGLDGAVPDDNPVIAGVRSHVYTYGHRNPQGLAFGPGGALYEAEHGPKTDDEINVLVAGKNYGWPYVAGFRDDRAYVYADWSASVNPPCESLEYSDYEIPPSVPIAKESDFDAPDFEPPALTFYTVPNDHDFKDPACAKDQLYYLCWPTIAPSSALVYSGFADAIPDLDGSLLVTSLKLGVVHRVKLGEGGKVVPGGAIVFHSVDRYRDLAVSPDGATLYVATDSKGYMLDDEGSPTSSLAHPGAVLAWRAKKTGKAD